MKKKCYIIEVIKKKSKKLFENYIFENHTKKELEEYLNTLSQNDLLEKN